MKKCLSREERFLINLEKQELKNARLAEREARKAEKLAEKERRKLERERPPTEQELVSKYAKRVIMNQRYHGRIDEKKFEGLSKTDSINKDLWLDTDFFFSVVFQSQRQKMEFLEKMGLNGEVYTEDQPKGRQIQIINGMRLAEHLNIKLNIKENRKEYPTGNIDLMPFVLDCESFLDHN